MVRPRHSNVVPGQHIYAYCNVKTKQVLYSLTRALQHRQLQQLPDTGANNNPPKLRKDLWRPLWSLQLPEGEDGVAQGQEAYRMLRDFRTLHEVDWEPPKAMSIPYTPKQIETLEKKLDRRGGSKKESPYDLIARRKWKMRTQMVMDQKTNSIADLAAVLLLQEKKVAEQLERAKAARDREIMEMERLADEWERDDGAARKELERQIQEWTGMRDARQRDRRWRKLNGKVDAAQLQLGKMKFAAECVPRAKQEAQAAREAREEAEEKARRAREYARQNAEAKAAKEGKPAPPAPSPQEEEEEPTPPQPEIIWTSFQFLPSFPPELTRAPLSASKTYIRPGDPIRRHIPPVFALNGEGVTVRWANTLDAEYAAEWPALVRHEPMGMVRNTAPRADDENPFLEVAEFKAVGWKSREQSFSIEPTLAEKVEARRREMGMVAHPTLKNKLTRIEGGAKGVKMELKKREKQAENREGREVSLEEMKRGALKDVRGTMHKDLMQGLAAVRNAELAAKMEEMRV